MAEWALRAFPPYGFGAFASVEKIAEQRIALFRHDCLRRATRRAENPQGHSAGSVTG
jgi:hypothetical protein